MCESPRSRKGQGWAAGQCQTPVKSESEKLFPTTSPRVQYYLRAGLLFPYSPTDFSGTRTPTKGICSNRAYTPTRGGCYCSQGSPCRRTCKKASDDWVDHEDEEEESINQDQKALQDVQRRNESLERRLDELIDANRKLTEAITQTQEIMGRVLGS